MISYPGRGAPLCWALGSRGEGTSLLREAEFYDNDNGFALVAEYRNGELRTVGSVVPGWLQELMEYLQKQQKE